MGYKNNLQVKEFVQQRSASLEGLADCVLGVSVKESQRPTHEIEDEDQHANSWVDKIVESLSELKANASLKNSYIKGPLKTVMRLFLGQLLAAALRTDDVDYEYIGCAQEVLVAGKKKIDELVKGTKAVTNLTVSRLSSSSGRPQIKDFLLNGLQAMCKEAKTVQCRASMTSFVCALCFSIMKGEQADHVNIWRLSESASVSEREREGRREGGEIETSDEQEKEKQKWKHCGGRRFLKGFPVESQKWMLKKCMLAVKDGGFWLMPHWKQFPVGESFTALGDAFLPEQVFVYVRLQDEAAATSGNVYKNRFTNQTDKKTMPEVQGMFQVPERQGWKWIPLDVAAVAQALGLAFQNVADAHTQKQKSSGKQKQKHAISDDEANSTDEQLAGAAKTELKQEPGFHELLEEVLVFLSSMAVRQRSTVGAKGSGSSSTHFPEENSSVTWHGTTGREVFTFTSGDVEDSRSYVDGGGDGDSFDTPDRSESGIHAAELIEVDGGGDGELCDNPDGSESGFHTVCVAATGLRS
jgi:hypothetical protein